MTNNVIIRDRVDLERTRPRTADLGPESVLTGRFGREGGESLEAELKEKARNHVSPLQITIKGV